MIIYCYAKGLRISYDLNIGLNNHAASTTRLLTYEASHTIPMSTILKTQPLIFTVFSHGQLGQKHIYLLQKAGGPFLSGSTFPRQVFQKFQKPTKPIIVNNGPSHLDSPVTGG